MELDIDAEINKLNEFINGKEILPFKIYKSHAFFLGCDKVGYLLYVLNLTYDHPQVEIYLKQLLENYSVAELTDASEYNYRSSTFLHYMILDVPCISFNSFDIIINFGLDVNSLSKSKDTPLHLIRYASKHVSNIISLFVKYGADLNILNHENETVLDIITNYKLNKHFEIIIMTLIDFGARTNNPYLDSDVKEFIESYRSSSIKPAIKN